jgi:hypothetical protein
MDSLFRLLIVQFVVLMLCVNHENNENNPEKTVLSCPTLSAIHRRFEIAAVI